MLITSPAFSDGGPIPRAHTCDGADLSPPLNWKDHPEGTAEFALILHDPDAPVGDFTHWVTYGIPGTTQQLPSGIPSDGELSAPVKMRQGVNDFRRSGYGGPCPPPGSPHRYVFNLYALGEALTIPPGATRAVVERAIKDSTLDEATLTGTYGR